MSAPRNAATSVPVGSRGLVRRSFSGGGPRDPAKNAWPIVRLGDIGTMTRGNGIKRCETLPQGKPCIRYGEIYTSFNVVLDKAKSFVSDEVFDSAVHIKKGDLVFTLTGENQEEIGKTLAYLGDEEIAAGGDLAVWTNHGCDPMYLAYLMYSPKLLKAKADASNGNIIVHLSVKKVQQIETPLPPLPAQREIVARLEKELGEAEKLAAKFKRVAELADDAFKVELDETFKAVEMECDSRVEHVERVEGASDVLAAKNAKPRRVRLGDVCEKIIDCPHTTAPDEGDGIPLVRTPNVGLGRLVYTNMHRVSEVVYNERVRRGVPQSGDLIFAREAPAGNVAVIQPEEKVCLGQRTVLLKPRENINSDWLAYYILSPASQERLLTIASGSTVTHVNVCDIKRFEITLVSLPAQRAIVAKLDAAKERCEKLKAAALRGLAAAENLRKAILAEAFE